MPNKLKDAIDKMKEGKNLNPNDWKSLILGAAREVIAENIVEIKDEIKQEIKSMVTATAESVASKITGKKGEKGDKGESVQGPAGPKGPKPVVGVDYTIPKDGKNGRDGSDGRDGKDGKDGKDGSPDRPREIADKLNTLTEALEMSVIKGLPKYLANLANSLRDRQTPKQTHGGGNILEYYDLSPYLNGVLKTFTIPANRKVIQIISSSAPFAFRPTVDYTSTRTSLTFDAAIDAASMLANTQSVLVIYAH
jgi:phage terminase small subunit